MLRNLFMFVGGLAVGTAVGILFAPEKGEETRKKIADNAKDIADKAKSGFDKIVSQTAKAQPQEV